MASVEQSTALDEAIAAVDEAAEQIGVLSIITMARYTVLGRALAGYGNLEDARYNFAMESDLLADAHKQWKSAADALELLIALDVKAHPETGEHEPQPYQYADGTQIHPGCACDGSKPFGNGVDAFHSLPFAEPSMADLTRGNLSGFGDDE